MKTIPSLAALLGLATSVSAAPVILNEYNAYENAPVGAVGGDWFELVVVGGGIAGDVVDMRGWKIEIQEGGVGGGSGSFTLAGGTSSYWRTVQAGTILTFHENNLAAGGRNTSILGTNNFATEGWAHTNIYVGDTNYVLAGGDISFPMTENNMGITIRNGANQVIFGPAGEGVFPLAAGVTVGSDEVFKLEGTPSTSITTTSPLYNDGTTSTFGAPNRWEQDTLVQDFSAFIVVPEPASALMAGMAAVGLLTMRRRRR